MENMQLRLKIVDYAMEQLNKKYVWDKAGPEEFDCSGLTWFVYKTIANIDINKDGYGIGDTTKQMTNDIGLLRIYKKDDNNKFAYLKDLHLGDLIFFHRQSLEDTAPLSTNRYPGHVGIYIGSNSFIHASSDAGKVIISNFVDDSYWLSVMVASRDIFHKNSTQEE